MRTEANTSRHKQTQAYISKQDPCLLVFACVRLCSLVFACVCSCSLTLEDPCNNPGKKRTWMSFSRQTHTSEQKQTQANTSKHKQTQANTRVRSLCLLVFACVCLCLLVFACVQNPKLAPVHS